MFMNTTLLFDAVNDKIKKITKTTGILIFIHFVVQKTSYSLYSGCNDLCKIIKCLSIYIFCVQRLS